MIGQKLPVAMLSLNVVSHPIYFIALERCISGWTFSQNDLKMSDVNILLH